MLGAILGDIVGSPYEFDHNNYKHKDFPLLSKKSHFTDDTVMTVAVARGLIAGKGIPERTFCAVQHEMRFWGREYPHAGYGGMFRRWLHAENPKPYGSFGNGSAMRVSAAGWLFDTLDTTSRLLTVSDTMDVVVSDTVGFIRKLPHQLVEAFKATLEELEYADLLLHVIDVSNPEWQHQAEVVEKLIVELGANEIPRIDVFNKCDRVEAGDLRPHGADICSISARTGDGLDELMRQLSQYAQEGPQLFPDGMTTDQADSQVCAEIVREKMLRCLDKEIPHGTAVEVTKFSEREDTGIIDLDVTIYCEKASHKGIIIGRGGEMLKRISSAARRDIEKFMGTKVYMETWVKVKENWRDNPNFIRSQGYNED